MENKELYPELAEYIFNYGSKFFTPEELLANRHLMAMEKSNNRENERWYQFYMKGQGVNSDKQMMNLVEGGFAPFMKRVTERIFKEHVNELELNLCPVCNKICRTPKAKQCRFCFHDWH